MLSFEYTARDPKTGAKVKALVDADDEKSAAKLVQSMGLSPTEIRMHNIDTKSSLGKGFRGRVKTKEKIIFSRQLSTLIDAGLPLLQSLHSVQSQTRNKTLQAATTRIISDIEAGLTLSAAIAKFPNIFSTIFVNLIAAGETSGTLDKSLERLATQQEKDAEVVSKVRGAMIYPAIVLAVMVLVVGFMLVKVLPQVQVLYDGIPNAHLPILTRVLLGISNFLTKFWWIFLILVVFLGVFTGRWVRTLGGKKIVDKIKMRTPPFGQLFMKLYMARFARTAHTLVASGVPLLQVLQVTGKAVDNYYIEESLKAAADKVRGGKALSDALTNDPNFTELVPNMLKIGEQSGALESMLDKTATYYEKEVDEQIKTVSTIIEPVMMVALGVAALIIVVAVLLPVYGLAGQSGFGG